MVVHEPLQGRRLPDAAVWPPDTRNMQLGDYMLVPAGEDHSRQLFICDPMGNVGRVTDKWTITENENGTITVEPSIDDQSEPGVSFHGWLRDGVWTWAE